MRDDSRPVPPALPDDTPTLDVLSPGEGLGQTPEGADAEGSAAFEALERMRREKRRKKRIRGAVAAAVVLAAALAVTLPGILAKSALPSQPHPTGTVTRGDLVSTVNVTGSAQPVSSVIVMPEVDGIVQDLQVSEGDTVEAGQLLFSLKNDSLDRAVGEAEKQVELAQRSVTQAQNAKDMAYANYRKALDAWNAAGSAQEQAQMQDPDELYASSVLTAADSLDSARLSLGSAQQALSDAQAMAGKRRVTAPVSGSVTVVNIQNGSSFDSSASAGTIPLQIADLSKLRVTTSVNEMNITSLSVGQKATVTFSALPGVTLDATVERIATVSESAEMGAGNVGGGSANYKVSLIVDAPDPHVKPGMTADATIETQHLEDCLLVPLAALRERPDGSFYVLVLTGEKPEDESAWTERNVKVAAKSGSEAAVTGVEEGAVVDLAENESAQKADA